LAELFFSRVPRVIQQNVITLAHHTTDYAFCSHNEKPFPCLHCDSSFRDIYDRNSHIFNFHKGQPYVCFTCGEKFEFSTDMREHLLRTKGHIIHEQITEVNVLSPVHEDDLLHNSTKMGYGAVVEHKERRIRTKQ
ncbi:hypothetical protein PMAYCL1PPCAC_05015, partial [Pristionchus mayeri]